MIPPVTDVVLVRRNVEEAPLVEFISSHGNISIEACRSKLREWCNELLNMEDGEKHLRSLGSFYVDAAGRLQFRSQQLHSALMPEVPAARVIRREANHQILVGDKESTSFQMAEYFQDTAKVHRQRWWIAAVVISLVSCAAIVAYLVTTPATGFFGNRQPVPQPAPHETYTQLR